MSANDVGRLTENDYKAAIKVIETLTLNKDVDYQNSIYVLRDHCARKLGSIEYQYYKRELTEVTTLLNATDNRQTAALNIIAEVLLKYVVK